MNALDQLQQVRLLLEKLDQQTLDIFVSQNSLLVKLFAETLFNFRRGIENVKVKMPTEIPIVQKTTQTIQLDNAKQDKSYYCSPKVEALIKEVNFSQECGLYWNKETKTIEGTATVSGEIQVSFILDNTDILMGTIWINPNPQKLWNNIPSNKDERFWKEDSASHQISTNFGKLLAARMRGRSHAHKGTCCDDDFAIAFHEKSGVHFIAVADGAGSAEFSRLGSKLAVEKAKDKILEQLEQNNKYQALATFADEKNLEGVARGLLYQAVQAAFFAQKQTAEKEQIPLKSLSCTLLLALTLPLKDNKWFTACYWIGDGAVAILNLDSHKVELMGEVDTGCYSGETVFLTGNEIEEHQKIVDRIYTTLQEHPPITILMTDGVSDPKFQTDVTLQTFEAWQSLWNELKEPLQSGNSEKSLENWLDFWSKGEHDDRTLAIFVPQFEWEKLVNQPQNLITRESTQVALLPQLPDTKTEIAQENFEEMKEAQQVSDELQNEKESHYFEDKLERTINSTHNNKMTGVTLTKTNDQEINDQGVKE